MITDEELFREWQSGNAPALEILVRRYHAPLLAYLFRLLGDLQLAEDLVQETFVRLVRDARAYHYPRPFRPWLYAIAHHLAYNHQASAYHRREELRTDLPETSTNEPGPAEWLERWEQHHGLQQALAKLSFEQREVLNLRFGQELSVNEAAAILGVPPGTVKSRTFTALRLLRDILEQPSLQEYESKAQGEQFHG
jgi:RNA polymerase sigma-70 factor (ECF subfamily)